MRDPIDRTLSAYNHYLQCLPESKHWGNWSPDKTLYENLNKTRPFGAFNSTNYPEVLKSYLKHFPKDRIHIIIQERLLSNPDQVYKQLFKFLEVRDVKIDNNSRHSRKPGHGRNRYGEKTVEWLRGYFHDQNNQLFDLLGYQIDEWL